MAKYVYPAVFSEEADGGYSVRFPDVPGCYTGADTLEDALKRAEDALCLMLCDMEESGSKIKRATRIQDVEHSENEFVSLVGCDTLEYRKLFSNRTVKKTLTIPAWLNTMAERQKINFSAVLQEALREKLNI